MFVPDQKPLVIGHRGAAGLSPENTLPSFARAYELGVQAVELDVPVVVNVGVGANWAEIH